MKILISGFAAFLVWCVVSAWLYNDKLLPVINQPDQEPVLPAEQTNVADSLMKLKASMPANLIFPFEFNDARFRPDPQAGNSLAEFKAWLEKYPSSMLSVEGYTDLVGTNEFNDALGLKRSEAVANFLVEQGIPASRIIKSSAGESKAYENYITQEGRAKNRKTEVSIKMQ
jgi:outer membrane protein OmpA-like peptidoglycan-associated protein